MPLSTGTIWKNITIRIMKPKKTENTYKVALTRIYLVTIKAQSEEHAKRIAEFYLGNCLDISSKDEQKTKKFFIQNIEMVYNESNESTKITD